MVLIYGTRPLQSIHEYYIAYLIYLSNLKKLNFYGVDVRFQSRLIHQFGYIK
jgi:hypothetical protein